MLGLMIERVKRMKYLDEIVVATTVNEADQPIVDLAMQLGVGCYRGSENDVLGRVLAAAQEVDADVIVELTGDCPLIDPHVSSQVIEYYLQHEFEYVSNIHFPARDGFGVDDHLTAVPESYPIGNDTEVFSVVSLALADRETNVAEDREHVSPYLFTNFSVGFVPAPPSLRRPELRLTLDYESDYVLIKKIFESLYPSNPDFTLGDILRLIDQNSSEFEPFL